METSTQPIDVLERLTKLPPIAFFDNTGGKANASTTAAVVAVKRGVMRCYPIHSSLSAVMLNTAEGVSKAQAAAMYMGSLLGWEVPAADPDNYDEDGKMRQLDRAG